MLCIAPTQQNSYVSYSQIGHTGPGFFLRPKSPLGLWLFMRLLAAVSAVAWSCGTAGVSTVCFPALPGWN